MNLAILPAPRCHRFDARGIAKPLRHAALIGAIDALEPGETLRFTNDHDPLALLAQLRERYGDGLSIETRTRNPGEVVIDLVRRAAAPLGNAAGSECCGGCG